MLVGEEETHNMVDTEVLYGKSRHLKRNLNDKKITFLLIVVSMVIVVLLFTIVVIELEKERPGSLPKDQKLVFPSTFEEFAGVSLIGNNMVEIGRRNSPILNWNPHYKRGNILLKEGCKIQINQTGFYYVHAQMFFFQNKEYMKNSSTTNPVMDFGIKRLVANDRLLSASVQRDSCKVACTHRLSSIVELRANERLIVDTTTPGVKFKMLYDKALFYVHLISKT